jgi:Kef-type K+ transport system membrane component KefB
VTVALAQSALFIVPWWFVVGIIHFGFVTGPRPTFEGWLSEMAWSVPPAVLVLAVLLRKRLSRTMAGTLTVSAAILAALAAVVPIQIAMAIITLTQWAEGTYDSVIFLAASVIAFGAAVLLTSGLTRYAGLPDDFPQLRPPQIVECDHHADAGVVELVLQLALVA